MMTGRYREHRGYYMNESSTLLVPDCYRRHDDGYVVHVTYARIGSKYGPTGNERSYCRSCAIERGFPMRELER